MNPTLDTPRPADLVMTGANRILGLEATGLADHISRYGPLPQSAPIDLVGEVSAAGLRGRGGAGFPTSVKMDAVRTAAAAGRGRNRVPVVVANGTEGEPASFKDRVLLTTAPHLVLDGMVMAALALGADRTVLCIDRTSDAALASAERALAERRGQDPVRIDIAAAPPRYATGEETALVSWLSGGPAKPTFAPPRPFARGVDGRPTLVDNVETLANIALIARYGAAAYRLVGDQEEPGTMLVTVNGAVRNRGVYEVAIGTGISEVLDWAGSHRPAGVLLGGYFGTWLTPGEAAVAELSRRSVGRLGASLGCGLIAVVPEDHCPLQEVANVLAWLAASSAGQCGACVNGLPALAGAFDQVARQGDASGSASALLDRWVPMIAGRGACKLPDGAIRFVDSARRVFADHIDLHRHRGACTPNATALLPTPAPGEWR